MRYAAPMGHNSEAILKRFDELGVWKQGDQRAPHKPLLVLYALGRWQNGQEGVTFQEIEPDLTVLLPELHPKSPFRNFFHSIVVASTVHPLVCTLSALTRHFASLSQTGIF
jgi:hypothetical protein